MSDELLGSILNDKYRLDALLGAGAMGLVYRAAQLDGRGERVRDVAVKMIRPELLLSGREFAERFVREISAAARLRGPHAIPVYDFGEAAGGRLFYVMELVEGPTLKDIFAGPKRLPEGLIAEIGAQICSALDEAHHLHPSVIHRDLKPGNIFVEGWPVSVRVRVGDFGLAKLVENETLPLTQATASPGTPRYMSPEQCSGQALDVRSDLYAIGVILYEGVAGKPPFSGEPTTVMYQHVYESPPPLPASVPAPLRHAIGTVLAKAREDRPASAAELRRLLTGASAAPRPSRPPVRILGIAAVAVLAALALWTYATPFGLGSQGESTSLPSSVDAIGQANEGSKRTGIAVFEFRNERSDDREHDWIRSALQTTFSTELGKIRQVRVLSREIVEQSATKDSRPIELTRLLGAQKLITGSFTVVGKQIQIAARLVDAHSGEQERAESIEGHVDQFFGLQKQLTLAMVSQLPIAVSANELDAIARENPSENQALAVDAYRRMLQAEGLDAETPDSDGEGASMEQGEPYSMAGWIFEGPVLDFIVDVLGPAPAAAQQPESELKIRQVLESYRQALEMGDLEAIERTWGTLSPRRRKGLEDYFSVANALKITFDRIEIRPLEDDRFEVSYVRRDQFSDRRTGEQVNLEVQLVNTAVREGTHWRIKNAKRLTSED